MGRWVLALLAITSAGCSALHPLRGEPARKLSCEYKSPYRSARETIDLSMLRQVPPKQHLVDGGDVLGVYVKGVLGDSDDAIPVMQANDDVGQPSIGFPVQVDDDGTITLPMLNPIYVSGMSIPQVRDAIRQAYTTGEAPVLQEDRAHVHVSLHRPRRYNILVIREESGNRIGDRGNAFLSNVDTDKRGTGRVVQLPAHRNDVLNALAETGGLPGLDAEPVVYILRGGPQSSCAPPIEPHLAPVSYEEDSGVDDSIEVESDVEPDEDSAVVVSAVENEDVASSDDVVETTTETADTPPTNNILQLSAVGPAAGHSSLVVHSHYRTAITPVTGHGVVTNVPFVATVPNPSVVPGHAAQAGWSLPPSPGTSRHEVSDEVAPLPPPVSEPETTAFDAPEQEYGEQEYVEELIDPEPEMFVESLPPMLGGVPVAGQQIIRIPLKVLPGEELPFSPDDIVLQDGDIVFVENRVTDFYYTAGLLGGGQYMLPRDYDIGVMDAIAIAEGDMQRTLSTASIGGASVLNQDVSVGASRVIIQRLQPNGSYLPIEVNLYETMKHPERQVMIEPGDRLVLRYTRCEALFAFFERFFLEPTVIGVTSGLQFSN